jgi:hypothetical protein
MRTIFCKHYTGTMGNTHCKAGVAYDSVTVGKGTPQCTIPCCIQASRPERLPTHCDKLDMPTPEELEAEDREIEERMAKLGQARKAIVAHLGGPWRRGTPGASGVIDCPACGGKQTLRFSRAGYNGHIHARCSTTECVSWME